MEFKVLIYVIGGILYFVYTIVKKNQENKAAANEQQTTSESKPVSPPVANPLEEVMREVRRKQAEIEAQKAKTIAPPKQVTKTLPKPQPKTQPREILIHEKQKGVFAEGNYERDLTDEERIERGKLKIENEGIYRIKSIEETEVEESDASFKLDIRNAIIGQVVLERKF